MDLIQLGDDVVLLHLVECLGSDLDPQRCKDCLSVSSPPYYKNIFPLAHVLLSLEFFQLVILWLHHHHHNHRYSVSYLVLFLSWLTSYWVSFLLCHHHLVISSLMAWRSRYCLQQQQQQSGVVWMVWHPSVLTEQQQQLYLTAVFAGQYSRSAEMPVQ